MKQLLMMAFFMLLLNFDYAQTSSTFLLTKMNRLYIGIDNPIEISVPGFQPKDITAEILEDGTIEKKSDDLFIAKVVKVGSVTVIVKAKGKEINRQDIKVVIVPDPFITLSGKLRGGRVEKISLMAMTGLVPILPDFPYPVKFEVSSFRLTLRSNAKLQSIDTKGPLFTSEMKALIESGKPDDVVIIDDIAIVGPGKIPRKIDNFAFILDGR